MVLKKKNPKTEEDRKKIQIRKDNPVAKALMEKKFQTQVKPSKKVYHRKRERQKSRQATEDA